MPPLIPRAVLLANPRRSQPVLSPDGIRIAYLAPNERDVLQIWVRTLGQSDDRCVSAEPRSIQSYQWAWDSKSILYRQDNQGDENFHFCTIDLETANVRDLTPWQGVRCSYIMTSGKRPGEILAVLNVRDRKLMDVWRIDLRTGAATLEVENPGDVIWWVADDDLVVRAARVRTPDDGFEVRVRTDTASPWRTLLSAAPDQGVFPLGFNHDGREVFLLSSLGSDTIRVVARAIESDGERVVASMDGFDAERVMIHPSRQAIEAVSFEPGRRQWSVIDGGIAADFEAIRGLDDGDFRVVSRDSDDRKWIVEFQGAHRSTRYYLWDRAAKQADFLFSDRPEFDQLQLAEVRPIRYFARDGLEVHGYLALPAGIEPRNLPLVLNVHGGPWLRDYWTLNLWTQLLANRGYAVLQPNYRGSMGYGMKHLHAGDRNWGLKMQDDLTDAVKWAVDEGIAGAERIAIIGLSYGGYAAVAGAAFTPELYKCAIDLCGGCNLFNMIRSFPPYIAMRALWNARVGNPDDPADKELLTNASPLFAADRIRIPLLIVQGANDSRTKQSEAEEIVATIEKNGGAATYVLYSDEGHGLTRPSNTMDFLARVERFLAEHLGGRCEPMDGERIEGSSALVRVIGPAK
ncbi:MAG TPA: alpha/beta fold hydrolase [Candidatus Binatus sp.]|uniref:S9 family peptidase n=1 Tax=Candidatus Binatus sp. TaxID=2811406 RepID=UPI002F3EE601